MRHPDRHRPAVTAGYSLIEVIVATGLLAVVLLAIGTALVLGGRLLRSGASLTRATALGQDIMEVFEGQSFTGLYGSSGAGPGESRRRFASTDAGSFLAAWQPEISRRLPGGWVQGTVEAVGHGRPVFADAAGIRLTVEVIWMEEGRWRRVALATVRF